ASPPPATPMRPLLTMDVNIQEIEQDFVSKSTVEIYGGGGKYALQNPINLIFTSSQGSEPCFLSGDFMKSCGEVEKFALQDSVSQITSAK
ncbi:MAG: hypothetical protein ACYC54_15665, partial [Sedimentisphaerales bacterium]